eukprot:scaffold51539_cov69-Cyclotella_meneghiniana.AAC.3
MINRMVDGGRRSEVEDMGIQIASLAQATSNKQQPTTSSQWRALWFVWPAVDDGWKISVGIKADPEAAAKAAEAAKEAPVTKAAVEEKAVAALPAAALQEIEEAPKAHAHVETDQDKLFVKAASTGDFTYLEEKWEEFADKSTRPGEDDDEDEEDDDGESFRVLTSPDNKTIDDEEEEEEAEEEDDE